MHIVSPEALSDSILEQVADAVVVCDMNGIIQRSSRIVRNLYGKNPDGTRLEDVFSLFPAGEASGQSPLTFLDILHKKNIPSYEVLLKTSGKDIHFILNMGKLDNETGEIIGCVITLTDISERKRNEEILREDTRRKDEFLAVLAHELRNPLAPIQNAVSLLAMEPGEEKLQQKAREVINRQLRQLARLVDDLLDVSRITHNKIELQKESLNISRAIESALETSMPLIKERQHTVTIDVADSFIHADFVRIGQVFANVINNAAKYTPAAGHIRLTGKVSGDNYIFSVADNGSGIEENSLPYIFNLFMQGEGPQKRSQSGLGIGLTLAQRLLILHEGHIEAKSAGKNQGSEFIITLPLAAAPLKQKTKPLDKSATRTLKILIVDDNADSAQTISWMMEALGHQTQVLFTSVGVIETAKSFKPDVMLLDIGLPGMSGYELCQAIRQIDMFKNTVMIAQTGWGQNKDKKLAQEAGFDHHLIKPFDLSSLTKIINSIS